MPITSVGSLVALLREICLLDPPALGELDEVAARFSDAASLARHLVGRGWLTPYQANQPVLGRGNDLLLGHYILLERLGEGGMGAVFKARHRNLDRLDAVKVIRPGLLADQAAVERFRREAKAVARLSHAHIVRIYDAGAEHGRHFLAMEYVAGTDLFRLVQSQGKLGAGRTCQVLYQAALGLQHAYEQGLVHRDIKPSNQEFHGGHKAMPGNSLRIHHCITGRSQEGKGLPKGRHGLIAWRRKSPRKSEGSNHDV